MNARPARRLQECKALNQRLIDFLKLPESVAKLLEYITEPAGMDSDDKRQFKYPFSSCEVSAGDLANRSDFADSPKPGRATTAQLPLTHAVLAWQVLCCEVDTIFGTLLEDPALCGRLFSLLAQPRPLDCMLAGYFARVLVCILMRRSRDLLRYLKVSSSCCQDSAVGMSEKILPGSAERQDELVPKSALRHAGVRRWSHMALLTAICLPWLLWEQQGRLPRLPAAHAGRRLGC